MKTPMAKKKKPKDDQNSNKLRRWKSEFSQDFKIHQKWWNKKREWEKFYDGEQLSQEEKAALAARGQPQVVINLIKPRVDAVVGEFLGRRVMMRARDRGTADFEKAKFITEALRYIEDRNRFDEQEFQTAKNLFISGLGWYKVSLEFDFLEPEIKISHRSNDEIIIDRHCRKPDLKDAKRLWETVWVEVEDLIEMYPDQEDAIRSCLAMNHEQLVGYQGFAGQSITGDDYAISDNVSPDTDLDLETFVDPGRKRIRLVNVWERVQKKVEFAFHPNLDGSVVEVSSFDEKELSDFKEIYKNAQYFSRTRWELNSGIFIANKILEDKQNVRPHDSEGKFPFSRALGNVEHETNLPYGIVRQYIDPQKEYNKRRSKLLHRLNTNRIVMDDGAVDDVERARKEAARPDGVVVVKTGKNFNISNSNIEQADVFMLQLTQTEIEAAGIAKEFSGQESKVMSGRAIELRQVSADRMLRPYYSALRSARRDAFSIALEEMQQYWTSQKLIKITDDTGAGQIVLNQRRQDEFGNVVIENDLRLGKYDVKIDEDMETLNQRQENFDNLVTLAQFIVQSGQAFPLEMLIEASNLPKKRELIANIMAEKQRQAEMLQLQAIATAGAAQNGQNVSPT